MMPRVTVGICAKNAENTIGETIESILSQDYPADLTETIIVDGNSVDATLYVVRKLLSKARLQCREYSDGGKGLGYARQIVVNHAHGTYILFVDSDVVIRNDFIREQVEFLNAHPRVGVGLGRYMCKEGGGLLSSTWNLCLSAFPGFVGCAFIFRKEATTEAGGFDEQIKGAGEEVELIERIQSKGWESAVTESAKFYHNHQWTLRSFWSEHSWFGYSGYYLMCKNRHSFSPLPSLPPGQLIYGFRMASKFHRSTQRKLSFFILPLLVLRSIAWTFGFLKAAMRGYRYHLSNEFDS